MRRLNSSWRRITSAVDRVFAQKAPAAGGRVTAGVCEALESRVFLTGVTVITHGYTFNSSDVPGWTLDMARAILDRSGAEGTILEFDPTTGAWSAPDAAHASFDANQQFVAVYNWASESDSLVDGSAWLQAAADGLFGGLNLTITANSLGKSLTDLALNGNSLDLHLIGHSRGAVLNTLVTQRYLEYLPGVKIAQVTSLDAHPADAMGLMGDPWSSSGQRQVPTLSNVVLADSYYQHEGQYELDWARAGITAAVTIPQDAALGTILTVAALANFDFDGVPVNGAYNLDLTNSLGNGSNDNVLSSTDGIGYSQEHSDVHLWYYGTITQPAQGSSLSTPSDPAAVVPANKMAMWYPAGYGGIGFQLTEIAQSQPVRTSGSQAPTLVGAKSASASSGAGWPQLSSPFNGSFDAGNRLTDAIPGWQLHGGGGDGHLDGLFGKYLWLGSGTITHTTALSRTHNTTYVPAGVEYLGFSYAGSSGTDDLLQVFCSDQSLGDITQNTTPVYTLDLSSRSSGYAEVPLPTGIAGHAVQFGFSLTQSYPGVVDGSVTIDNVSFIDASSPYVTNVSPAAAGFIAANTASVDITFSEPMRALAAADLRLSGSGSTGVIVGTPVLVDTNTWRFPLSGISHDGPMLVSLGSAVRDIAYHTLRPWSASYTVAISPQTIIYLPDTHHTYDFDLSGTDDLFGIYLPTQVAANPSVTLAHAPGAGLTIELFDRNGNAVGTHTLGTDSETIDVQGLPAGPYLIRVHGAAGLEGSSYALTLAITNTASNASVVTVIDISGSMDGTKIEDAKSAARLFAGLMNAGDRIGVVAYSTTADTVFPLTLIHDATSTPVVLFSDSMDSMANWTASGTWGTTTSTSQSNGTSLTDSPTGSYANYANSPLTLTQSLTLPADTPMALSFWTSYDLESSYDYGRVEVSTDGATWTQLTSVSGTQSSWIQKSVSLEAYAGQSIYLRFRLTSDGSVTRDGWYIDDVLVSTSSSDTRTAAQDAIAALYATDSTSIGAGIHNADVELDRFPLDPSQAMIVMTDGQENTSPYAMDVINSEVAAGIRIFTIGFGSDAATDLLTQIANARGGQYYYAADGSQLQQIYSMLVGSAGGQQQLLFSTLAINPGGVQDTTVAVDGTCGSVNFGINWPGSDLDLALVAPDGTVIDHATQSPDIQLVQQGTYEYYRVQSPMAGNWTMRVNAVNVPHADYSFTAYAMGSSAVTASLATGGSSYAAGQSVPITVELSESTPITGAQVVATVVPPDASGVSPEQIVLYDDGNHGDGAAGDGVYGGAFTRTWWSGQYSVTADAAGMTALGAAFHRAPTTSFNVTGSVPPTVYIADAQTIREPQTGTAYLSFTLSLSAAASSDVTVDWATAGGTATPGSDFAAASGTVTFAAGETSKLVTIQVLADDRDEQDETAGIALSNAVGATVDATVVLGTIQDSLPNYVMLNKGKGAFTDADGDTYQVSLAGPGQAYVAIADSDGDGKGPIRAISLQGTDAKKSSLQVTVVKKRGDGIVSVGRIEGTSPIKSISMAKSDLVGVGINLPGVFAGAITLRNTTQGADIVLGGSAAQKTSISAGIIGDGTSITTGSTIQSLKAVAIGDGVIAAPAITSLVVTGNKTTAGNMGADVLLTGTSAKALLGTFSVTGIFSNATIRAAAGSLGSISVGAMDDVNLYAGYSGTGIPGSRSELVAGTSIRSVSVNGIKGRIANASNLNIAAATIGSLYAAFPATDDSIAIAADALNKLTAKSREGNKTVTRTKRMLDDPSESFTDTVTVRIF